MTRRTRTFLLIGVYAAVPLLLIVAEIALRLWAPGLERPLVRAVTYDGIAWYEVNRSYPAKYFPPGTPLIPEFKPALFRRVKSPNAIRIFCLGESSMFGTPYQMTAGIPGILRRQLRHAWPGREIEVVNFGASAINSNVILDLSRELVRFSPDLVVLYAGHNEFYGPDGVGAGFLARMLPASISWKYRLRDLRLARLLLERDAPAGQAGERNLMRQVAAGGTVPLASDEAERIFARWEENLSGILQVWKSAGVPVIVSDVSSNLMFPPFVYDSLGVTDPRLAPLRSSGETFAGDRRAVEDALAEIRSRDTLNAFVEYWYGRMRLMAGDSTRGRTLLVHARDLDLLKFRAPSRINAILHAVCAREGVRRVSADSLFASMSVGGIPGDSLFWEHLHPTLRGYAEIATMLAREILSGGLLPPAGVEPRPLLGLDPDTLAVCWLDRAYGDISIGHLTGRWPFSNYHRMPDVLSRAEPGQRDIAQAVYDRRIVWDQGCYQSAARFWSTGNFRAARTTYEAVLEEYPFNFYPRYLLGNLLGKMGRREEAMVNLRKAITSNPAYPRARLDLGLLLINEGRFDEAIAELSQAEGLAAARKSVELLADINYGLGAAYANKRDFVRARRALERALQINPHSRDARSMLDRMPAAP
jgi:lysophospholipase L1-like esterase